MSNQWSIPGNDDPENWREMTAMERLARIEHILLLHPRLRSLLERIDQCALSVAEASPSQIHSPLSMAIAGQPGVGKTVLTKIWLAEAMRKTQPPYPYQYLCIPAMTTLKALLAALLCAVTDSHSVPLSSNTTVWMMENRLSRLLPTSDIRLIIVDNCDHLIWHQSKLERRVGSLLQLPPFNWDRRSPETVIEWRSLLSTLDRALPFDESGLAEEDRAYRLFYATDGVLGWLMKLISFAARKAIFNESTTLRVYDLADAYNLCIAKTSLGQGKVNPFSQSDFGETGA